MAVIRGIRRHTNDKITNKGMIQMKIFILLIFVLLLLGISILAPYIVPNDPYTTNSSHMKAAPDAQYPFGTDRLGRCLFSRVLMGARTSVFSTLLLVMITMVTGTFLGVAAGYLGGVFDNIIMRLADIVLAFPQMVLAVAVAGVLGGNMTNAMLALGITGWTLYARLARGRVMAIKKEEFIDAARLSGNSSLRIMIVHILPNIAGEMVVNASIQMGMTMVSFAGLSYLGLGVQVPKAEWGSMINEGIGYMQQAPGAVLAPGAALFITVVIFNLLGDALSDYIGIRSSINE